MDDDQIEQTITITQSPEVCAVFAALRTPESIRVLPVLADSSPST